MVEVYAAIYGNRYTLKPESLEIARRSIREDLALIGISQEQSKSMRVLNVGTGLEAVALHEFQFQDVYHVDLSPSAVESLMRMRTSHPEYGNLHTAQLDLCAESLPFDCKINCVYLNGVLHHFRDPGAAVQRVLGHVDSGTLFFARIYRNGSLLYLVVDFIRRFIDYADRGLFLAFLDSQSRINMPQVVASDMWDDFFVPVLALYDAGDIANYFRELGWSPRIKIPATNVDHSDPIGTPYMVALAFEWNSDGPTPEVSFPAEKDQLEIASEASDPEILSTVNAMRAALPNICAAPSAEQMECAVDLYWIARRKTKESAHDRHRALRSVLSRFLY